MATSIQIRHVEGLRLRQQTLREVPDSKHKGDGQPPLIKAWKFEPDDVRQDLDIRTHQPLGIYTAHTAYNLRNLVIERAGKGENVTFRNANVRQVLNVKQQVLDGNKKWRPNGVAQIPPNTWGGVFVGDGNRAVVEELPT